MYQMPQLSGLEQYTLSYSVHGPRMLVRLSWVSYKAAVKVPVRGGVSSEAHLGKDLFTSLGEFSFLLVDSQRLPSVFLSHGWWPQALPSSVIILLPRRIIRSFNAALQLITWTCFWHMGQILPLIKWNKNIYVKSRGGKNIIQIK